MTHRSFLLLIIESTNRRLWEPLELQELPLQLPEPGTSGTVSEFVSETAFASASVRALAELVPASERALLELVPVSERVWLELVPASERA